MFMEQKEKIEEINYITGKKQSRISGFVKKTLVPVSLGIVLAIMSTVPVMNAAGDAASAVKTLEYQIEQNLKQQQEASQKLKNAKANLDSEMQEKAYIDQRISLLIENISNTDELIALYTADIAQKEVEIENKKEEIDEQYKKIKDYLRLSYQNKILNYVEMILGSDSLSDLFTNIERVGNMINYQEKMMESLNANLEELDNLKTVLEQDKLNSENQKANLESQKEELEQLSYESSVYMQKLEADSAKYAKVYAECVAKDEELNAELEKALLEYAKQQTAAYVGGELMWPVDLKWNRISSPYGNRVLYGVKEFHLGIDIPAGYGENIYAANDGTIIKAQWHYSYGNYIIVDHGGGRTTLYAHASKLCKNVGDTVKKGDVIALIGSTGNSYGNHLHFEVRQDGKTQDPMGYVVQP
ncbi:MAG: hypothetical protein E7218_07835 [Anaerofustis stercorihominis]|nr:hypothetical protein [Anaerofustis stercorihominis]